MRGEGGEGEEVGEKRGGGGRGERKGRPWRRRYREEGRRWEKGGKRVNLRRREG